MTILRSPGLAIDPPATVVNQLHDVNSPETVPLQVGQPVFILTVDDFQFIDSIWVKKQIRRSKRGTAVDQWGWDSKEMCWDIISDDARLHLVAKHWILPIAAVYLPLKYRDHLAGGRLVALSKRPKRAFDLSMLRMHGDAVCHGNNRWRNHHVQPLKLHRKGCSSKKQFG